ncbi:unnamed protein product [Brassica rapa subsp. narinosa]
MRIWQNTSDPFRSLYKITALIEILFDYVHVADDGIYRSIDPLICFLKTFSQEACNRLRVLKHATDIHAHLF